MESEFMIIKRDADGSIYNVYVQDGIQLGKHISACYYVSDDEVLAVVKLQERKTK